MRFGSLFLYTVFVGLVLFLGGNIQNYLKYIMSQTFNPLYHTIFITIFPVIIGIFLALLSFIDEFKKQGTWKFDWIKFLAIGLPTFYATIFPLLYYSFLGPYISKFLNIVQLYMGSTMMVQTVGGIVFGHLILCCFYKKGENNTLPVNHS